MEALLLVSISARIIAVVICIAMLRKSGNWRMGVFAVALALLSFPPVFSLQGGQSEIPGFLISLGLIATVALTYKLFVRQSKTGRALAESEAKFRALAETTPSAIFLYDSDDRILYANVAAARLTGYSEEELCRMTGWDLIPARAHEAIKRARIPREKRDQLGRQYEFEFVRKDGQERWAEFSSGFIEIEGKAISIATASDITERKRAGESLRQSEEKYSAIFEKAPFAASLLRLPDGAIEEVNEAFESLFGYSRQEVIGKTSVELGLYADSDMRARLAAKFQQQGFLHNEDARLRTKSGEVCDFLINTDFVEIGQGKHVLTTAKDITERKRAEADRERLLDIIEASLNEIYVFAPDTLRFEYVNQGAILNLGYHLEQLKTMTPLDLKPEFTEASFRKIVAPLLERKKRAHIFQTIHRRADSSLYPVEVHLQLVESGGKKVFLAIIIDITERRRAEQQLRESHEEMRALSAHLQSVREEERTRIAREIHDELGSTLTGLKMDLAWIGKRLSQYGDSQNDICLAKIKSLAQLVESTGRTVRRISTELRPGVLDDFGIIAAIEWQASDFENRTGIKCNITLPDKELDLDNDRSTALFRIFQETLTNVARHAVATEVRVSLKRNNGCLTLKVKDNGQGIAEKPRSDTRSFGIVGMRERALLLGGDLDITSIAGKGTAVTVRIPVAGGGLD